MLRTRVIPCLQLIDESLVKTIKFDKYGYIGDPINTVRIFNELEVDELCFLDIRASIQNRSPNFKILSEIADECFIPLSYGGGIRNTETAKKILSIGFEKIIINTAAWESPGLITCLAEHSGNQSIIVSIDVKRNIWGKYHSYIRDGTKKIDIDPIGWAQAVEKMGAGEILLTSIDNDGTWKGYDLEILKKVTNAVSIPVIANGGAGSIEHIGQVIKECGVSAVALGSMIVYQRKGRGVLINYPERIELEQVLNKNG